MAEWTNPLLSEPKIAKLMAEQNRREAERLLDQMISGNPFLAALYEEEPDDPQPIDSPDHTGGE